MKRLKIFTAALTLVIMAISFSSFISNSFHKEVFVTRCWYFNDPTPTGDPTAMEVTTSANYAETTPTGTERSCIAPREVLCGICFNDGNYPVNVNNQPDFAASTTLTNEVKVKGLNPANHGMTINAIKYFFRHR